MKARVREHLFELRETLQIRRVQGIHLLLCLGYGCSGLQPCDVVPIVRESPLLLLRRECKRYPETSCRRRKDFGKSKAFRHHSNDGERAASQTNILSNHPWPAGIELLPESV